MTKRFGWLVLLAAVSCGICLAQEDPALRLANQVRSDVRFLAAGGTFGVWRTGHGGEAAKEVQYVTEETVAEDEESPFSRQHQKCSVSVVSLPGQVTRAASFYAPRVKAGKLPPLPLQMDRRLTQRCELGELWYIVPDTTPMDYASLVAALESAWGQANGQAEEMGFGSSNIWHGMVEWHRDTWNVWIVPSPSYGSRGTLGKFAIAVRRSGMTEDSDWLSDTGQQVKAIGEESAPALARLAALDPVLSATIVRRARCSTAVSRNVDATAAAGQLKKWIGASKGLPPVRRAAALLLADDYMTCLGDVDYESREPFTALGAEFNGGCAQDGGAYGHTFRHAAEKLDPGGLVGAWGQLADLWTYCAVENDQVFIAMAEKLLLRFPQWRPYLHYLIGRAHGTRLAFAFPGGFPEDGDETQLRPLSTPGQRKERLAAIQAYRSFVEEKPNDPEAVFAWQEAWRLLAGLKPSAVEFGCTCE